MSEQEEAVRALLKEAADKIMADLEPVIRQHEQELADARQVITLIYNNLKDNRFVEGDIALRMILTYVSGFLRLHPAEAERLKRASEEER